MRNPITSIHIPRYDDYPEIFSKIYKISNVDYVYTDKEFLGTGQEFIGTCMTGAERSVLLNDFHIRFSREYNLIQLKMDIRKTKKRLAGKSFNHEDSIKKNGAYLNDLRNIADFFNLNSFNSNQTNFEEIKGLIDYGITPIIYRPFNDKDTEGHFVVAYAQDTSFIYIFDPAYRGERPRENIPHKGTYKKESPDLFIKRWTNNYISGGFVFLCDKKDKPKMHLEGYYLN